MSLVVRLFLACTSIRSLLVCFAHLHFAYSLLHIMITAAVVVDVITVLIRVNLPNGYSRRAEVL